MICGKLCPSHEVSFPLKSHQKCVNGMEFGGWNVLAWDPSSASRLSGTEEQSRNLIQHLSDYMFKKT